MKCLDCGGDFIEKVGSIQLDDDIIGSFNTGNVKYSKCNQCGELRFPSETIEIIEAKESEIKSHLIGSLSLDDFIGATKVAAILGISRQAVHKHRRIRRGFIYSKRHEGILLYHKKSVELFRKTGDGRFPLFEQPKAQSEYNLILTTIVSPEIPLGETIGPQNPHYWTLNRNIWEQNHANS